MKRAIAIALALAGASASPLLAQPAPDNSAAIAALHKACNAQMQAVFNNARLSGRAQNDAQFSAATEQNFVDKILPLSEPELREMINSHRDGKPNSDLIVCMARIPIRQPDLVAKPAPEPSSRAIASAPQTQPAAPSAPDAQTQAALELALWNAVANSNDPVQMNAYLEKYPNGTFAGVAHAKIAALTAPAKSKPAAAANSPAQNPANATRTAPPPAPVPQKIPSPTPAPAVAAPPQKPAPVAQQTAPAASGGNAALLADLKKSCSREIQSEIDLDLGPGHHLDAEEQAQLDASLLDTVRQMDGQFPTREKKEAWIKEVGDGSQYDRYNKPGHLLGKCVAQMRLRQMAGGAPAPASNAAPTPVQATAAPSQTAAVKMAGSADKSSNTSDKTIACIQVVGEGQFAALGIKTNSRAVLRNSCAYAADVTWCVDGDDCHPGYSNLTTIASNGYYAISAANQPVYYAACRAGKGSGFADTQRLLSAQKQYACK